MVLRCLVFVCLKVCPHHGHRVGLLVYYVVLEEPLPALVLSGNTLEIALQILGLFKEVKKYLKKLHHYFY